LSQDGDFFCAAGKGLRRFRFFQFLFWDFLKRREHHPCVDLFGVFRRQFEFLLLVFSNANSGHSFAELRQ